MVPILLPSASSAVFPRHATAWSVCMWASCGWVGVGVEGRRLAGADLVDLAMEVRARLATGDGGEQRAEHHGDERDHAAGGQGALADRDARQVELAEDVVLRAEHRYRDCEDDRH